MTQYLLNGTANKNLFIVRYGFSLVNYRREKNCEKPKDLFLILIVVIALKWNAVRCERY